MKWNKDFRLKRTSDRENTSLPNPTAMSMLAIMKTAFEKDFAQYVHAGKKLRVKITGMADASPINGKITYDGCYGEYTNEPVYKDNDLSNITVTKESGVTQNDQLAFLRAVGVKIIS